MVRSVNRTAKRLLRRCTNLGGPRMVLILRRGSWLVGGAALGCMALGLLASVSLADNTKDIQDQKLKQKTTQVATEELVERIGTMLRVMEYYQPDKNSQHKTLERIAHTLAGLSRAQMEAVLKGLDKAAAEPDADKSSQELQAAHERHIEIMTTLRGLLAEFERVRTLDEAADKIDKLAKAQLELALQTVRIGKDQQDLSNPNLNLAQRREILRTATSRYQIMKQLGAEQKGLQKDLAGLLTKANDLKDKLPEEQQLLLDKLNATVKETKLQETLKSAASMLEIYNPQLELDDVANLQRKAADDLKDLAAMLRTPKDQLAALRKAREQLDDSIRQQEQLQDKAKQDAAEQQPITEKEADRPKDRPFMNLPGMEALQKPPVAAEKKFEPLPLDEKNLKSAKESSEQQARLALDNRETKALLQPFAKDAADKLGAAQPDMKAAEEALRKNNPAESQKPQDKAVDALKEARAKIADMIAKEESKRIDPLAALKDAKDQLDRILKDQIKTRDTTKDAAQAKQTEQLPKIAPEQKDLAKRTDAIQNAPLPLKSDTQESLDKATKAMDKATLELQDKKAPESVAKKTLKDQIAEIEKRRDDIAKLEDAAQKLDRLAKEEGNIADRAKDASQKKNQPDTKNLADKQDKVTPEAKDLAKNLDQLAPKAAEKVEDSTKNMDAAKNDLAKNQAEPGAKEAKEATDKLKEAQNDIAKKIDDLKAKELADQAALNPKVDPQNALQQLEKALEQAKEALQQAKAATEAMNQKELAELQKQLADQAKEMKLKAANPANDAAKDLQKGDFQKALQNQKEAFEKLQKADKAGELAQQQKKLMDATKQLAQQQAQQLAQSQQKTQGAMQALGQAMGNAPQGSQKPLQNAAGKLGQANQQLARGEPGQAQQSQQQAIQQMQKALQQMQGAQTAGNKGQGQPKEPGQGQPKEPGQGEPGDQQAKGQEPGQGQGQGQPKGNGQPKGQAQEKNEQKGQGDRIADGKVSNGQSQLRDVTGDDNFLHLPPRQRELIRQALAGELPPEYAAQIQQYYLNISGNRSTKGPR
jgi:hypothetical protein